MNHDELKAAAETIRQALPNKNQYDQPIWAGVLKLIEDSEFGKRDASSFINSPLPESRSLVDEAMDGSFDGVQMKMLSLCLQIFKDHGNVSMQPYTGGIGTRSMTLEFKAKVTTEAAA